MSDMPLSGFVNQLSQILLPVSKGLGFTVLPQSAVESFPNREELHVAQLKQTVYEDLYLVKNGAHITAALYHNKRGVIRHHWEISVFRKESGVHWLRPPLYKFRKIYSG